MKKNEEYHAVVFDTPQKIFRKFINTFFRRLIFLEGISSDISESLSQAFTEEISENTQDVRQEQRR